MVDLQEMQRPTAGIISLGYIYSVSFALLPTFVDRFYAYQDSDKTAFRFHQGTAGELIERLLTGTLDLLIAGHTDIPSIDCLPLYRQELFLAVPASHRLAGRSAVSLNDISEENFVSITHDAGIYRQLETQFKKASIHPKTVFEADEYSSIAASVTTGAGVAIMPRMPILNNFNVKLIPFKEPSMTREVCLLRCNSYEMTPAVKSAWEFARVSSEIFKED